MHIAGRKKKGYIIKRKVALAQDDPNHDEWEAEDTLVKSWLINSMTNQLMSHFAQCGMAKEVWDVVKRSYLDTLTLLKPNDMTCVIDIEKQRKCTAEDQVYIFLVEWYKLKQDKRKNKKSTQVAFTDATPPTFAFRITDHMTSHSSLLDSVMPLSIKSIQDNLMKMTIDIDKEREGFYSLERARKLQFEFDLVFQVARRGESYFSGNASLVPLQGEISSKDRKSYVRIEKAWILGWEEDLTDLDKGESLDAPNLMAPKFASKEEGIKDQPDYSNKVIQGRTKMLLTYPLQALILLLMILPCHRMTLPRLILSCPLCLFLVIFRKPLKILSGSLLWYKARLAAKGYT
ncbi:hypothetical protein CK203_092843 [Vitis vinifera]|uniref:Uncharacterized protein n=1 Tax=Vitis vinifera TaxID=29760 RepID=A0A438DF90_VITVI|nr:hypothetical protein CK203_092843 [Vitis vinifera]